VCACPSSACVVCRVSCVWCVRTDCRVRSCVRVSSTRWAAPARGLVGQQVRAHEGHPADRASSGATPFHSFSSRLPLLTLLFVVWCACACLCTTSKRNRCERSCSRPCRSSTRPWASSPCSWRPSSKTISAPPRNVLPRPTPIYRVD
jgi:hypothetical protein